MNGLGTGVVRKKTLLVGKGHKAMIAITESRFGGLQEERFWSGTHVTMRDVREAAKRLCQEMGGFHAKGFVKLHFSQGRKKSLSLRNTTTEEGNRVQRSALLSPTLTNKSLPESLSLRTSYYSWAMLGCHWTQSGMPCIYHDKLAFTS